jgi:hypothetical protein
MSISAIGLTDERAKKDSILRQMHDASYPGKLSFWAGNGRRRI